MLLRTITIAGVFALTVGQAPAQGTTTLQVDSRIVLLDVSVKDAAGHPVLDLRPEEFRITERKVPQTIKSFEPPTAHTMPGGVVVHSSADLPKIGQSPVTLILLDELNVNWEDRTYERTKLLEWLKRQPQTLAQPTALLAVTDKNFTMLRDYTQSRDEILEVLKKHTGSVDWRGSPSRTGSVAQENMLSTLGALERVAQSTRGIPGRKNVIWVGDGFPSVTMGDVGRTLAERITDALRKLSTALLQSRITLSVVGGLQDAMPMQRLETDADKDLANVSGDTGFTLVNDSLEFSSLAPPTGGHAYRGRNDLDAEIGEAIDDGGSFYTLSYRPTDASNDPKKYRRISVYVTRPGLTIQTRDGYFEEPKAPAAPPTPTTQQLAFDLFGAAMSTLPYTDLHVSVDRQKPGEYTLHAAAPDIAWREMPDGRRHADLVLLAVCLSDRGKMLSKTFATLGSNTAATIAEMANVKTALPMQVTAPAGTSRIRFVVRDMGSGRVGTADFTP